MLVVGRVESEVGVHSFKVLIKLAEVIVDFFVDVNEARRDFFGSRNRESKPHGGARSMIGVLAKNNHLDFVEVGGEGAKNLFALREDSFGGVGLFEKTRKLLEVRFLEFLF